MTELIIKKRRTLTDEQRAKSKATEKERQRLRREKERAWLKAHKSKKVPYTEKELEEQKLAEQESKDRKKEEKLAQNRPAIPLSEILRRVEKIGREKIADDLNFPEYFIGSWKLFLKGDKLNGWTPLGTKLGNQLQDYLRNAKIREKTR